MKVKITLLTICLFAFLLTGCGDNEGTDDNTTPTPTTAPEATPTTEPTTDVTTTPEVTETPDVVTTASIVNKEEDFEKAIGSDNGTWIICALNDLTFDKDLVLDGEYKNGKKDDDGNDVIQRKIALYEQDEERNVTARYTLTAPSIMINSPNARIQSGTFVGDIYVNAKNFQLVDTTVDGNVYFANEEAQSTFTMDETSSVSGTQELEEE